MEFGYLQWLIILKAGCGLTPEPKNRRQQQCEQRLVCYYTSWAVYRDNASMFPEDINPYLCTHIIYAFASIENGTIKEHDPADKDFTDGGQALIRRVRHLKCINPKLKILMAVGGWNLGSPPFEYITRSRSSMGIFSKSVMDFLSHYKLDGLDLDWEFPARLSTKFTELCQVLRNDFAPRQYLLTAAVSAGTANLFDYYEPRKIYELLDFINIMTYDFHGQWDTNTQGVSHHSPLNARSDEVDWVRDFNVRSAVLAWEKACGGRSKLVVGIPTYGKSYKLQKRHDDRIVFGQAADIGPIGPIRKSNEWAYFEVCAAQWNGSWKKAWHVEHEIPYMSDGKVVITYDNPVSAARKAVFIKYHGYGGAMFWTLDFDDFSGRFCKRGRFPIINAVRDIFLGM